MYSKILVPTDGTDSSATAVGHALTVAEKYDASVVPLYVTDVNEDIPIATEERHDIREEFERSGREATREVVERAEESGIEARPVVRTGIAHDEIVGYASENDIDLIAMATSTKERRESFVLGSTTARVVRQSEIPVLTVRSQTETPERTKPSYSSILVPTDGSDEASEAANHGIEIAKRYGARLHVVYVVNTEISQNVDLPGSIVGGLKEGGERALEEIREIADSEDVRVTTAIREGSPYDEILRYAKRHGVDLITMGSHGGSESRVRLGSTTRKMIETSEVPVMTVR